jgi:alkylation response protein AidB-like acyl-CoA dehydrogenase
MNFELTDNQKIQQAEFAKFCKENIAPQAAALDSGPKDRAVGILQSNLKKLAGSGYFDILLGDDLIAQCVAGEELAKACPSTFMAAMSSVTAFGTALKLYGTAAQKDQYLAGLTKGEKTGCLAYTEATAGSDISLMQTKAEKQGGVYILNGAKDLVTNAPLADACLVLAWTDPEAGLEKGTTLFLLEKGTAGLGVGGFSETMGLCGAPISSITLENCKVAEHAVVGAPGGGFGVLQTVLEYIKLALSSMSIGIGVACQEISTLHGKTKKAFGKPIGFFEGVGAKLAIMFTLNDIGRMLTHRAAWGMAEEEEESAVLTSCAKLFTSEGVNEIADLAMQAHGGHGYLKGTLVEKLYRDARFASIAYGTSEMQRAFIARNSLNKFK